MSKQTYEVQTDESEVPYGGPVGFVVVESGTYGRSSVLAGQPYTRKIGFFETARAAVEEAFEHGARSVQVSDETWLTDCRLYIASCEGGYAPEEFEELVRSYFAFTAQLLTTKQQTALAERFIQESRESA